jgi:phage tail sheath protein FI
MVFEPNDDALRFAIARSATTLLLEAFRARVLKGARPEEAFRVTVDDGVNTPQDRAAGRVLCEIAIAPAAPMELIHIRVGLSPDGRVEMVEA